MTQPTSAAIMRRRHWALIALRALAAVMILYGAVLLIRSIFSAYGLSRGGGSFFYQLIGVFYSNNYNPFWHAISFAVPGMGLAWMSRTVARWIVPAALNECPACGYALQNLTAGRCPECGYELRSQDRVAASD